MFYLPRRSLAATPPSRCWRKSWTSQHPNQGSWREGRRGSEARGRPYMMSLSIGLMASCVTSAGRRVGSRRACSTSRLSGRNKGRARALCLAKGFPGAKGSGGDLDTAAALLYRPLLRQPGSCHLAEGTEDHLPRGRRGGGRLHLNFISCVIYFA